MNGSLIVHAFFNSWAWIHTSLQSYSTTKAWQSHLFEQLKSTNKHRTSTTNSMILNDPWWAVLVLGVATVALSSQRERERERERDSMVHRFVSLSIRSYTLLLYWLGEKCHTPCCRSLQTLVRSCVGWDKSWAVHSSLVGMASNLDLNASHKWPFALLTSFSDREKSFRTCVLLRPLIRERSSNMSQ